MSTAKRQPATPLLWKAGPVFQKDGRALFFTDQSKPGKWQRRLDDTTGVFKAEDAAYLEHAAHAYPKLVEALKSINERFMTGDECRELARIILGELGEYP